MKLSRTLAITLPLALLPTLAALGVYLIKGPICMGQAITFDLGDLVVFFGSSSWLNGQGVLYRDILSEYPLLANLIFGFVRLLSFILVPILNAFTAFSLLWFLFAAAALALMIHLMRAAELPREAFWAVLSPPTIHFALLRYDIYPALFCFLALLDLKKNRLTRAAFWLGLCIAVKGYGLFLLPAFAVYLIQNVSKRETLRLLAIAIAPFFLSQLAILSWAGVDGVLGPFLFHVGREFNGESLYDTIALVMETIGISSITVLSFRDFIVASPLPKWLAASTALAAAAMRPKTFYELIDAWIFAVTGFILSSIFISPQWLLWIIPIACFSDQLRVHRLLAGLSYATFIYYPIAAGLAALTGPFIHSASMAFVNLFRLALMVEIGARCFARTSFPARGFGSRGRMKALSLLLVFVATQASGSPEPTEAETNSYFVLPFAAYTPETRLVLGGSVLALFRTFRETKEVPISTVSLSVTGTQNHQYVVGLSPDIFTPNGEWEFRPFLGFQLYPSSFVGIGSNLKGPSENYTSRSFNGNFYVQRKVFGQWRLGPFLEYQTFRNENRAPGGKLATNNIAGAAGTTFFGVGVNLERNDLDNRQFPTSGTHFGVSLIGFERWLGTTDPYQRLVLDLKHFIEIFPGHVLAGQIFSRTVFGTPPFQALSNPGGGLLRGADGTRALDRSVISAQLEYRFPLFYRLRGDVFAGLAEVAPQLQLLPLGNRIPAAGAGLRWILDRESRINVRFDYAWSSLGNGFYAAIGEGF